MVFNYVFNKNEPIYTFQRCVWNIMAPANHSLIFTGIEIDFECCCDFLTIYHGGKLNLPSYVKVVTKNYHLLITVRRGRGECICL